MFFDQPLEVKNEILNEPGPMPMHGYTPWRVEEVGKLRHDVKIRTMMDSKVCIDDILWKCSTSRLIMILRSSLIKAPNTTQTS